MTHYVVQIAFPIIWNSSEVTSFRLGDLTKSQAELENYDVLNHR